MFRLFLVYLILSSSHVVDAFGLGPCPQCITRETIPSSVSRLVIFNKYTGFSASTTRLNQDPNPQQETLVGDDNSAVKKKIDMDSIDAVTLEAEKALQQAKAALQQAQQKQGKQIMEEATAAGIGGASLGLLAGAAFDVYLATNGESIRDSLGIDVADIPAAVPPILLGTAIGATSYTLGSSTEEGNWGASLVRKTLGKATQAVGKSIKASVNNTAQSAVNSITSIPSKIQSFFQQKAQEAVNEVKAIPSKISTAAQQQADSIKEAAIDAVESAVDDIKATPSRVANKITTSAQETAESIKEAAIDAVESAVEDIKATPGRIVDSVQRTVDQTIENIEIKIEETVEDVIEKVEEVTSLPGKKLDELLGGTLGKEGESITPTSVPVIPKPPDVLPPMPMGPPARTDTTVVTKPPLSSTVTSPIAFDDRPRPPLIPPPIKFNLPQLQKEEIPSVKPPPPKKDQVGNFVFSEKSLKELLSKEMQGKDTTPEENQQKEEVVRKAQIAFAAQAAERKRKDEMMNEAEEKKQRDEQAKREEIQNADMKRKEIEATKAAEEIRKKKEAVTKEMDGKTKKEEGVAIKEAAKAVQQAKPGATISLGALFRFGQTVDQSVKVPKGIPTLVKWKQNPDRSISGIISGSSSFSDGERIKTSPITNDAMGGSIAVTSSGSRYFLEDPKVTAQKEIETRKRKEEEKSAQVRAAAEVARRKLSEEEKKQTEAAALKRENEERMVLEAREKEAARKATAKAKKVEEERKSLEVKLQKAEAEARRKAELEEKEAAVRARQAEMTVERAKPGATVSLGFFGFGSRSSDESVSATPKILNSAPRGVASLSQWRKNRDGSITGIISGSPSFKDGEKITTSPVTSDPIGGTVVVTVSGSKYYLEDARIAAQRAIEAKRILEETRKKERGLAKSKPAREVKTDTKVETKPRTNIDLKKREDVQVKEAEQTIQQAKPGATISLGLFGFAPKDDVSAPKKLNNAPRGMATISNWRQNRDGSVTGFISGSPSFADGERITTTPITTDAVGDTVVTTVSGSKYFLEDKTKAAEEKRRKQEEALNVARRVADEARQAAEAQRKELSQPSRTTDTKSTGSVPKIAPAGVPSLVKWKLNKDKSVTGFVSGSKTFVEGEQITTSPIVSEVITRGEVVKTGSGSKYFLV